ncbi:MAG: HAMP domain-containing protein [Lachnoclostridium sp.]|jgi:two-component system, sensor histidine kinase YesM
MIFQNHRKSKKAQEKTITSVLLGNYLKAMSISIVAGIIIFLAITGKEMVYRQELSNKRILNTVTYFINIQLDDIKKFCDNLIIDDELQDIFLKDKENKHSLISSFLMKKMAERNEISSIHILWDSYLVSEYKYPIYDYDPKKFISNLSLEKNVGKRSNYYWEIGRDTTDANEENMFYLVESIRSKAGMEHLGYLIAFIDTSELKKNINLYLEEEKFEVLIRSNSGNVILLPSGASIGEYGDSLVYNKDEDKRWWKYLWTYQYSSLQLNTIGGEIFGLSKRSIFGPNVEFAIIFMLIITIEFIMIASIIIKKKVIGPLEEIASKAREIGIKGKLDIQFPNKKYYSEADDISNALNEMMGQIRLLMKDVERREKLQRKLELSVINHQIKPHFLYNTLNAASILISVEEKDTANQLIKLLASYYRACLNQGNDIITVENELKIVEDYIKIVLIRNPNILRISYDIDGELLKIQIPKMTIQTLVENSIKYGIKKIGEPIDITIQIKQDSESAYIIVEDNGTGMKQDFIDRILNGDPLDVKSGFGVKSVVNRLSLLYDIKNIRDIISIEARENQYTRIILKIPANLNAI